MSRYNRDQDKLRPFEYALPDTTKTIVDSWVARLQAVAVVTALVASIEISLLGVLPPAANPPRASDTAVRFFGYSGFILNLAATLSSVLLLLAVASVPTASRRLYVTCSHGYPRQVFIHSSEDANENEQKEASPPAQSDLASPFMKYASIAPKVPSSIPIANKRETVNAIQSLNRFLLKGDAEGNVLYAFGIARGWGIMLRHCILCFLAGLTCSFVHVGIALWLSESTVVAAILMPVVFIGFVPPLLMFLFGMDSPKCDQCAKKTTSRQDHELDGVVVEKYHGE